MKLLTNDYHFNNLDHEKSWIIRTTINACKDRLRTAFWNKNTALDHIAEISTPKEPDSELLDLVMDLPRNYRLSIYLHYYEGYQVKEIAAILGKTENVISSYLSRGRKKLRQLIAD